MARDSAVSQPALIGITAVAVAKLLDSASTIAVVRYPWTREANPIARTLHSALGVLAGELLMFGLAIVTATAVVEITARCVGAACPVFNAARYRAIGYTVVAGLLAVVAIHNFTLVL